MIEEFMTKLVRLREDLKAQAKEKEGEAQRLYNMAAGLDIAIVALGNRMKL